MYDFDSLLDYLSRLEGDELKDFMVGITTENERGEFSKRFQIVLRLLDGQPQHKIAKDLNVGIATVTRGSKELQGGRFKALKRQRIDAEGARDRWRR